jgi:stearoyl-CoA desaturase (delta-9 desaturase)
MTPRWQSPGYLRGVSPEESRSPSSWKDYLRLTTVSFGLVHLAAIAGAIYYWSWGGLALGLASYVVRMIIVTAAYHRYFSHRAFKTSRPFQFVLAVLAQSAGQKGVIWWASHHRWHHKYSDTEADVHSAKRRGFWYSHVGWILGSNWNDTAPNMVKDLLRYPELRFLNHKSMEVLPTTLLALGFLLVGGLPGLVWGYMVSTVLLWHGSFSINSLAHLVGRRRYATTDDSRNSLVLALITSGEGWHNNHHHYPSSANQGFHWWEVDVTYYVLRLLAAVGLVWDLRRPPAELVAQTVDREEQGRAAAAPLAPAQPSVTL